VKQTERWNVANRHKVTSEERAPVGPRAEQDRTSEEGAARRDVPREEIAAREYERYRSRGGENGHDLDDWFEAEREVGEQKER